jgi:hypothetical protein
MVKRFDEWPTLLSNFLEERRLVPFEWGRQDCCMFACDAVLAMTGTDLAGRFRGTYRTAAGALRAIRSAEASTIGELASWLAELHSIREISVLSAQRGDVVLATHEGEDYLGIVAMDGTDAIGPGLEGTIRNPLSVAERAWRI